MPDYSTITELPESNVTPLQLERAYSRYMFGALFCKGKDVLEVACGGGQGLALLAQHAKKVVGGDIEENNLAYARDTYRDDRCVQVVRLDAQNLTFDDDSFDVVLLYEAIYYLEDPEQFMSECVRVLRSRGMIVICTANQDWPGFNPSPFSRSYFSVPELSRLCEKYGLKVELYGAFPDNSTAIKSFLKKVAVRLHLIPGTMKGKVLLKKIFYGSLVTLPKKLQQGSFSYTPPVLIPSDHIDSTHTAIFAVARK
jgi:ubiquinone/menaquinone biosynthesis C-methylase UbiE